MASYKPKDFLQVAEAIGQYFAQAEKDIVAMIAKNADNHLSQAQDQWLRSQQASIIANRKAIEQIIEDYKREGAKVLNRLPVRMYLAGVMSADTDLAGQGITTGVDVITEDNAVQYTDGTTLTGSFGIVHAGAVNALASAYLGVITGALLQITRNADDIYKKIINDATSSAILGSKTRVQATQDAIDKFIKNGVGGFRDKRGRWWSLEAYTQMATRTLITQALNQGKVNRYTEMGNDLVIVSKHERSCDLCRPWQRKILSLSGKTQGYPTFDEAKSAGLFHPNCGHTFTAYVEGLTVANDAMGKRQWDKDHKAYENQQKLRAMERRMRQLKLQEAKAVSPERKAKIQAQIKAHSAKINKFCKDTGIPRKRSNEKVTPTDSIKKADQASTVGSKGSATGSAEKPKKTQNSGANSKGQGKPKKKPKDEFDIDRLVSPNVPGGLRKPIKGISTRIPGRYIEGHQFDDTKDYKNPLHGMATVDKISNAIKDRYKTDDVTKLANAYQYYLTGHHLATEHKFAYTAEEWAKICNFPDPSRVAGFNRGGLEIWYGDERSNVIKKILENGKLTGSTDLVTALRSMSTILHEQIHSIRYNSSQFTEYRKENNQMALTIEEGLTQYLSVNLLENFLTYGGFLDGTGQKQAFKDAYPQYVQLSSYPKETGHMGLMAYIIGQKAGLSEKEVVTSLINAKDHVNMTPKGLAKAFSGLLNIEESKLEEAFSTYFQCVSEYNGNTTDAYDVRDFAKAIGVDQKTCDTLFLAISNSNDDPLKAYLAIRKQMWE